MSNFAEAMATGDGVTATDAEAAAALALSCLANQYHDHPKFMATNSEAADIGSMAIDEAITTKAQLPIDEAIGSDEEASDQATGIDAEITAPAMASNDEVMAPGVGAAAAEAAAMAFNQEATDDEPAVADEKT
ncbi:unnamed protein product [Clonostachys chloroleuca]|uniref:Uncharacterized protein n=1 Tax=Clonostachys chloroleuca TaxID=1926264 RepID=A0AA35LQK3_9HYPO|nr:unnamed protein product [Clonostachys chloroleuca]